MKKLTMTSPFTLVPDDGYPIHLFLLFPIALSPLSYVVSKSQKLKLHGAPSVTILR